MCKILLAAHDATLTGAPLVLAQLARLLQPEHVVDVWSPQPGPMLDLCRKAGVPVSSGVLPGLRGYDLVIGSSIASFPVIVHANQSGVAAVWWPHEGERVRSHLWRADMQAALMHPATAVVVSTEYLRPLYRDGRGDLPALIRYAVPPTERVGLARDPARRPGARDPAARGIRFLVAGSIEHRKGQDVALEAFATVRRVRADATCTLIGAGWEYPWARELAARHAQAPGVAMQQAAAPEAFAAVLDAHDVLLVPSRDEGGFPQVLLQAQERGLAVVAADICGMREQVEDGVTGLIAGDDAWASCMARLAVDQGERAGLGDRARAWVHANNDPAQHHRAWTTLIEETLGMV